MIDYPYLKELPTSRQTVEVFRGLNRNTRIGDGEFCEMENMTSDHYPVLAPRGKRGKVCLIGNKSTGMFSVPGCGLFFKRGNELSWYFYEQGESNVYQIASGLIDSYYGTQFVLMGSSLIIAPDMKWLDIKNPYDGLKSMAASITLNSGEVTISLCEADGSTYQDTTTGKEPPTNPQNMELWLDTSCVPNILRQYSTLSGEWNSIPATYLKISGLTGHPFSKGDAVSLSGIESHAPQSIYAIKGSQLIEAAGSDYIVIAGITDQEYTQKCDKYSLTVSRDVPQLDFIVEAGNRLWGCTNKRPNEIYASKLGDFKNWNVFSGISTDSWVGNVGTPGDFTGAVNHAGYPVFYKEGFKHKIYPSSSGAHQIQTTPCMGVKRGCYGSMALYNSQLLYASPEGVCMDDGSGPVIVDQALYGLTLRNASGGVHQHKYYLSGFGIDGEKHLLAYDLRNGLWHREDGTIFYDMASYEGGFYAGGSDLWELTGSQGTLEDTVSWRVRTGDLVDSANRKYISRLTLRLSLEPGSKVEIYACYDHEDQWQKLGTAYGRKLGSFSLPVRPRRCDHLQLELRGEGMAKVYSITKTLEEGSELG